MTEIELTDEEYKDFLLKWNHMSNVEYDASVKKEHVGNAWIIRWRGYIMYGDDFNGFGKDVYKTF